MLPDSNKLLKKQSCCSSNCSRNLSQSAVLAYPRGLYSTPVHKDPSPLPVTDKQQNSVKEFEDLMWEEIGKASETVEVDEFKNISLERGSTGVYDIEEFVEILRGEKLEDIVTIAVPKKFQYVDYMVITTCKSPRQMLAVAEFIRKIFKRRCSSEDELPVIEGVDNKDWIAMDLGNIAFHIFSSKARAFYDLETLWACGPEYDEKCNQTEESYSDLLERHSFPAKS